MRLVVFLVFVTVNCYSQNIYQVINKTPKIVSIARTTVVEPTTLKIARNALYNRSNEVLEERVKKQIALMAVIEQPICKPEEIAGGYNYLRAANRSMKKEEGGKYISCSNLYNGAHHIINKSAIEVIYTDLRYRAKERHTYLPYQLMEIQGNAPAVFHVYHNHPKYKHFFHDRDRQLRLYYSSGVYGILEDFFQRVDELNKAEGLPLYSNSFRKTTFLEAELWARHYGFKWKM